MNSSRSKLSKKWAPGEIRAYVMLMVEYLRISPSYALASEIKNGKFSLKKQQQLITELYEKGSRKPLSSDVKEQLVRDFYIVIRTYDEFGDLINIGFDNWWKAKGIELFGLDQAIPRAHPIAKINKGVGLEDSIIKDIRKHFATTRQAESNPSELLMSIPLGVPKKLQLRLVSKLLDNFNEAIPIKSARTSRPLAVQRLRTDPLMKGIHLLWLHAKVPSLSLWRLGVAAKVSKKYSNRLEVINSRALEKNADDRNSLTILTHRMLTRSQLIAESAAHGIFPSHIKRPLPFFDPQVVNERVLKYKANLKRR